MLDDDGERSLARVNHGGLSWDEVDAARRAVDGHGPVLVEGDGSARPIVAVAAGPRVAVVCRLAVRPAGSRLERVLALGDAVRLALENEQHERQRRRMLADRVAAGERVNRAAAYDLHDGPAQKLLWARNALKLLARDAGRTADDAALLDDVRAQVASALDDVRAVMSGLDAAAHVDRSLQGLLADELALLQRRSDVAVELELDDGLATLDATTTITVFRLVQEALTNAVRHGGARRVRVAVRRREDRLEVCVEDDGRGFDPASPDAAPPDRPLRLGLRGMRERVTLLAGTLDIASRPGGPTLVHAVIPVAGQPPALVRRPD